MTYSAAVAPSPPLMPSQLLHTDVMFNTCCQARAHETIAMDDIDDRERRFDFFETKRDESMF